MLALSFLFLGFVDGSCSNDTNSDVLGPYYVSEAELNTLQILFHLIFTKIYEAVSIPWNATQK